MSEKPIKFTILLGGDVTPTPRLLKQVEGSRVIAADSGIAHAGGLALKPELWVGDFDSAGSDLQAAYAHVPRHVFPAAKDATDGEIAITEALKRGAGELVLVGGFGGQFDHVLAHAMFLVALAKRGILVMMSSGNEEAHPLLQLLFFVDLAPATRLSLIPLTEIKGLTITGVRWPLKEKNVPRGSTLTLSNECTGGRAALGLESGEALVVVYPQ
jgi:thiamine pyrophosphokinase